MAALASAVILASCGSERNPILGTWDVALRTGNSPADAVIGFFTAIQRPTLAFTETDATLAGAGPLDGSKPAVYRRDDDGRWMVCLGAEGSQCQFFLFQDEARTRATFTFMNLELTLTRRPEPASG
jgi:hypothetical protein